MEEFPNSEEEFQNAESKAIDNLIILEPDSIKLEL